MRHDEVLRFEELLRICRVLAELGVRAVRVTGGEALLRQGVADFIGELKRVKGIRRVTMTSNGVLLGEYLETLLVAGLDGVNISLDTLNKETFCRLSRGEGFDNIIAAIDRALELRLEVKINCVPLYDFNEKEMVQIANLAKNMNIAVRFIELMPLGAAASMRRFPMDKLVSLIEEAHGPLQPASGNSGYGPAAYYQLPGFSGRIGVISAASGNSCKDCNRLRLTASGVLKPCLAGSMGADLRSLVRSGAGDKDIAEAVRKLVYQKPAGYNVSDSNDITMYRIGG